MKACDIINSKLVMIMKRKHLLLLLSMFLIGCDNSQITTSQIENFEKINKEMSIMVASDLHLLSNNLISKDNEIYKKDRITSDGRVQEYDYELVEELVNQANIKKPSYLILSGDLTFNGEYDSHIELVKLLNKVNKETKVLVIPGNHDYNNVNAYSIINDKQNYVKALEMEEFDTMYKDFGYQDALTYDTDSLSYIYKLSEDKWILMLDSNYSENNYEFDMNFVGGELTKTTMDWLKENLAYAKENNIEVISTMHHNLLVHNELFKKSYTLNNNQELLDVYKEYGVKINFSGHLHIQSIKNQDGIYDIASGSLLDYGNRYGMLDIYENCYDYNSYSLNPDLGFDFNEYSFNVFYSKYYNKQVKVDEMYYSRKANLITDLNSKVNAYYFDGNYKEIHKLASENKSLIRKIKRNKKATYMVSIYNVENINQHSVLIHK